MCESEEPTLPKGEKRRERGKSQGDYPTYIEVEGGGKKFNWVVNATFKND